MPDGNSIACRKPTGSTMTNMGSEGRLWRGYERTQ